MDAVRVAFHRGLPTGSSFASSREGLDDARKVATVSIPKDLRMGADQALAARVVGELRTGLVNPARHGVARAIRRCAECMDSFYGTIRLCSPHLDGTRDLEMRRVAWIPLIIRGNGRFCKSSYCY